jgi:fructose 1,6-bisphosphatase
MGDIEESALELPSTNLFPALGEELEAFSYEVLPSGKIRYSHPSGFHDDCVISLGMANWCRVNPKRGGGITIKSIR